MIFIEKVIVPDKMVHQGILLAAWTCWCLSIALVLSSYFTSTKALRTAIDQIDSDQLPHQPGGAMACATKVLNFLSGILFVAGLLEIAVFAIYNLGARHG
jgi:hypothetical protein